MTIKLPPLPEWCFLDDLGGLVPSEVRTALRTAQREAALMALEEAAKVCDSYGHHWGGAPAHAFFEAATEIRAMRAELEAP